MKPSWSIFVIFRDGIRENLYSQNIQRAGENLAEILPFLPRGSQNKMIQRKISTKIFILHFYTLPNKLNGFVDDT